MNPNDIRKGLVDKLMNLIACSDLKQLTAITEAMEQVHVASATLMIMRLAGTPSSERGDKEDTDLSPQQWLELCKESFSMNMDNNVSMNCEINNVPFSAPMSDVNKRSYESIMREINK